MHQCSWPVMPNFKIGFCLDLKLIKNTAKYTLQPAVVQNAPSRGCTLMLLTNLREPDWISVSCEENLLYFAICTLKGYIAKTYSISGNNSTEIYLCKKSNIIINEKCHSFLWHQSFNPLSQFYNDLRVSRISLKEFSSLYHMFDAVSSINVFPTLIFQEKLQRHAMKVYKLFNKIHVKDIFKEGSVFSGYVISNFNKTKIEIGVNLYHCKRGGYVLHEYVCDGITDGPNDKSDEESCICNDTLYDF